jgi:transcriptional regulator with XRE-family HTH domain
MLAAVAERALDEPRNEAVRAVVRDLMRDRYEGNLSATARAIGVSPSLLSELLSGRRGAGMRFVQKLSALTGRGVDGLIGGEPSYSDDTTPAYRNLPGWKEAAQHLKDMGYRQWAIERAGNLRGMVTPLVTPEFAVTAVQHVMSATPQEELARLAIAEVEQRYKGAETRAANRMKKPANETGSESAKPKKGTKK